MIPRGEVALIIAGIGITAGILDEKLFGVTIMMTLLTTLVAPPFLTAALKIPGRGTKKETKSDNMETLEWNFHSDEIADLVIDTLLKDLKAEGFYVQMMNIDDGLSQARKGDVALSITEEEHRVTIETSVADIGFVKRAMFEVIVQLHEAIDQLRSTSDPASLKLDLLSGAARTDKDLFKLIQARCISTDLKGTTKDEIIAEMVDLLAKSGNVTDRGTVMQDVLLREHTMSTGMQHGIALPHGKSDGISSMSVSIGIKKGGVAFDSLDNEPTRLFIMVVSPKKVSGPHLQFLAAIGSILKDKELYDQILSKHTPEEIEVFMNRFHG